MAKLFGALLLFGAAFASAFYFGHQSQVLKHKTVTFQPTQYPIVNRSFAVVILGCNNGAFVEKTLQSVFSQNYLDFRIIYVDNGSDDGSFDLAKGIVEESGQEMRCILIRNDEPLEVATNLSRIVDTCSDSEIVVVMRGEDWLAHEWVLSRLNQYYADPDLWMSYGQYLQYPNYSLGASKSLSEDKFVRHQPFQASHLKTFYASLFRQIQPSDLLFATDFAYMAPMLEMAKGHTAFIPEILYIENQISPQEEEIADLAEKAVRSLKAYAPIEAIAL